jgi:outer membrane protein insertion porin family
MKLIIPLFKSIIFILLLFSSNAFSSTLNKIEIIGNDRISNETIKLFTDVKVNDEIDNNKLNSILKNLYETNFFKDISLNYVDQVLTINVIENSIIENISYEGIKNKKTLEIINQNTFVKSRSSYNENILKKEKKNIENILKDLGYYNTLINISVVETKNNLVDIIFNINLGKKAKIKKITFIGNKIFKDKKLRNIIASSEYKFWKIISGRKYLNQNIVLFDERLLKNFYINNGYYDAQINSSFAKLVDDNNFELIFNINSGAKFFFGNLNINLPSDFDEKNFVSIKKLFKK